MHKKINNIISSFLKLTRRLGAKVAHYQTIILLTVVYIVAVPLFVVLFHLFKNKETQDKTYWSKWKARSHILKDLKKQF